MTGYTVVYPAVYPPAAGTYSDIYSDIYESDTGGGGTLFLSYDPVLSRVLVDLAAVRALLGSDDTGAVQRSSDNVRWQTVRGAASVTISATAIPVSDYEFTADVANIYRVVSASSGTAADEITPVIGVLPWLKNLRFPFLNRPVKISDVDDLTRPSLGDTFTVLGQSLQVAIPQMRGPRQTAITVETTTDDDTEALHDLLSTGDPVLLQVPGSWTMPRLGGYYSAGDTVESRQDVAWSMRWTSIPLTEVEPPDDAVAPITGTWATVVSDYATWAALVAGQPTWDAVVELVGAPGDVIVS